MSYAYKAVSRKNLKTDVRLFFPATAPFTHVTVDQLAAQISEKCTATRADIMAVLSELQTAIGTALLEGQTIRLGSLGSFRATLKAESVDEKLHVSADLITGVRCVFTPSSWLKIRLKRERLKFKRVDKSK